MIRKKRGYSRQTPKNLLKDYKLFAIACEGGKREPNYFRTFEYISNRIKVDIIEDKVQDNELYHHFETKSAPKWVLDRAVKYIEQEGLIDEDELWFIIDVDNWQKNQIYQMIDFCDENDNWNIVLSNPCFEVWLYLHHKEDFENYSFKNCKELKQLISELDVHGYEPYRYIKKIKRAALNARAIDQDPNASFPYNNNTKVYKLVDSLFNFISEDQFNEFCKKKRF